MTHGTHGTNGTSTLESIDGRIDALAASLKSVVERLAAGATSVEQQASAVRRGATTRAGAMANKVTSAIETHPLAAIGIAFGAGFLLMRMIRK